MIHYILYILTYIHIVIVLVYIVLVVACSTSYTYTVVVTTTTSSLLLNRSWACEGMVWTAAPPVPQEAVCT